MTKRKRTILIVSAIVLVGAVLLLVGKPAVLIYGTQRAGLYAAIALPMALVLGIVGIVNLAHGEFLMAGAYLTYLLSSSLHMDPLISLIPIIFIMFFIGMASYKATIKHVLRAPELNQLILTFGIAMILSQTANLIASSQTRKLSVPYVTASATIGDLSFGVYDFVYTGLAIVILAGLLLFLRRTKLGKAALAVGQNPVGARLVGIDVDRTYMLVFSVAIGILGLMGVFFTTRFSIFPLVGGPYTMKSFCLVAMAGIGNLPGILLCSLGLGVAESFIMSFRGASGWADIVFFALIVFVIMFRSYQRKRA